MPFRLALASVCLLALLAGRIRAALERPPPPAPCEREGRGEVPRHWIGCAADPGPRRGGAADERLALGLPVDPNVAGTRALSFVPGLSPHLAAEVVSDREANGPYASADDLLRVRGIGPKRLALALPHLRVEAARATARAP